MSTQPASRAEYEPAYRIEHEDGDIVVRLPSDLLTHDEISRFLDYLVLQTSSGRAR